MSLQEVTAFFGRYRDAFNQLDGDAVADLWSTPGAIADAHGPGGAARVTAYGDAAALRANMVALCGVYRQSGFARADFAVVGHRDLGAAHSFADLHWTLTRADGSTLQSFRTAYQLGRDGAEVRAYLCIAYEEDLAALSPCA